MIISASYRTDIPALYAPWFEARFRAGFCRVRNPYGGAPGRVSLRDGVDGYVFWTRNIGPFLPALDLVRAAGLPFVVQYTVTGYPRPLEAAVAPAERSLALIATLAERYGRRAVVWRYDPILISDLTPAAWHRDNFARLADALRGRTDEVVTSFAQLYRKTGRNLAAAGRHHHFGWEDPPAEAKLALLGELAEVARAAGMTLSLCTQPALASDGLPAARCIDAGRLGELAGRPIAARQKGNRPGCLCAESRDIGAYDSCPQGCVYCYAVSSRSLAKRRLAAHDPAGEYLVGAGEPTTPPAC